MCGIAGANDSGGQRPTRATQSVIASIGHQGPDGERLHIARGAALAQVRLAIIDLKTGQPIRRPGGPRLSQMRRS